jgi:dipeptidyl-peptidase-4
MIKIVGFFWLACFVQLVHAQDLSVERIWKTYEFRTKGVDGFNSMKDGVSYTKVETIDGQTGIVKHAIEQASATPTMLVNFKELVYNQKAITVEDYQFNSDETKLIFQSNITPIYRHSYSAVHFIYDLQTKKLQPLDEIHSPQTLAEYSPDGTKIAYICKNDLYVKDLATGKVTPLTTDGKSNKIINGTTDWVYEEEFAITKGFEWSPDSKMIAYLKFNEKQVREFTMAYYTDLYPEQYSYKYPKAGEDNSKVTAHIVTLKGAKDVTIPLGNYEYIPRLSWAPQKNQLILQTLNRHQNELNYWLIDAGMKKLTPRIFYNETAKTYVEIDNNLILLQDGTGLLRTSEKSGYNHVYKVGFDGSEKQLTNGNFDVIEFLGVNESLKTVYYSAAASSAINKGIYSVQLDGTNQHAISLETGYNDAEFLTGMRYFVKTYSDANTPPVISLCKADGSLVQELEDNKALADKLKGMQLPSKTFTTYSFGTYTLNGWIIKPANFDSTKKYPVFMTVYGGPGNNEVTNKFDGADYMYHQLLAQKGYIVVCVDPRGTMYQGEAFKKCTYLQLGKYEIEDVIAVAKRLQGESFVDANRIGIQGWSYGGFMASLGMTKGADVFKMGIAVAPVTNWRYYDNIYTERFMRTPQENAAGYDENSPVNFAQQLKGSFLLIHGSADDNVHYQNSMEFVKALVAANKQFDLFIYPNKNHGIYGGNTRNHLFTMMLDFTLKNL